MTMWYIFASYALILGLLIGSFLNVVIARLPKDQSVVSPRSRCPSCMNMITAIDNIPIVSWLILRGKCRNCAAPISSLYPTIELLTGILSLLLFWRIIPDFTYLTPQYGVIFGLYLVFVSMLIAQSFIDIRYFIIPDQLSIYPIPFFIAAIFAINSYFPLVGITWKESFLGAFFGGGSLLFITLLWKFIRKKDAMGMGDIKLLALIGAVLGPWPALPMIIFLSSTSAVLFMVPLKIVQNKSLRFALPFGPFLAIGSIIWILHGRELVRLWLPGAEGIF